MSGRVLSRRNQKYGERRIMQSHEENRRKAMGSGRTTKRREKAKDEIAEEKLEEKKKDRREQANGKKR